MQRRPQKLEPGRNKACRRARRGPSSLLLPFSARPLPSPQVRCMPRWLRGRPLEPESRAPTVRPAICVALAMPQAQAQSNSGASTSAPSPAVPVPAPLRGPAPTRAVRTLYPPAEMVKALPTEAPTDILYDAVIIGSGMGGLATAAQMVAKGAKVVVLEK